MNTNIEKAAVLSVHESRKLIDEYKNEIEKTIDEKLSGYAKVSKIHFSPRNYFTGDTFEHFDITIELCREL